MPVSEPTTLESQTVSPGTQDLPPLLDGGLTNALA